MTVRVACSLCHTQNWELSARVPLIIAAPNKPKSHGVVTVALVELVDVRPRDPQRTQIRNLLLVCTALIGFRSNLDVCKPPCRSTQQLLSSLGCRSRRSGAQAVSKVTQPHRCWKSRIDRGSERRSLSMLGAPMTQRRLLDTTNAAPARRVIRSLPWAIV